MQTKSETNRYLASGVLLGAAALPVGAAASRQDVFVDGPRRPAVARPLSSGTISESAIYLETQIETLAQAWKELKVLPVALETQDEWEILVVDPDEIGFVTPEYTLKARLQISGFRQGQPQALPLDDIDLEIFDV